MKSTRKAYGEFLAEVGEDSNIVVLDADLAGATKTDMFMKKYPQRHIDVGIAEQDLVGTACGLALAGKTVFASTFAMFMAGRAYDQIRNTACKCKFVCYSCRCNGRRRWTYTSMYRRCGTYECCTNNESFVTCR